jgi:hypothetical protein
MDNLIKLKAHANALGAAIAVENKVHSHFCGVEGIYRLDIIDEDYRDRVGHDSTVTACRDTSACLNRYKPSYK